MKHTLLTLAVAAALGACSGEAEKPRTPGITVEGERILLAEPDKADFLTVGKVEREEGRVLPLPGRLVWNEERTVRIFPQLAGRVLRIAADVGSTVREGQPLAELASPDYGQAEADARKARADLHLVRQAVERQRELHAAGVLAEKDWQQTQAEAARAEAEADRCERRLRILGGQRQADGTYLLRSPVAGVVVERNLGPGLEVRPDQQGQPLFVVTDPTHLWVQIDASEADVATLQAGQKFSFSVKQYPGESFEGTIRHIADFVDPVSRTLKIRGEVPNPGRRLKGEMFVTAAVEQPVGKALHVPAPAVFVIGEKRFVFVEEAKGRYLRREIQAGAEREGRVEVQAGLKEDERVLTGGHLHFLKFFKATPSRAAR